MSAKLPLRNRSLWPIGLVTAFALFIAGIVTLVLLSTRTPAELVSPDYYDRELHYQEDMNRVARTRALGNQVSVAYDAALRQIMVALPAGHVSQGVKGEIHLYRPSEAGLDRFVPLAPDVSGQQKIEANGLSGGLWRVRVTWRVGSEDFACDEKLIIGQPKPS